MQKRIPFPPLPRTALAIVTAAALALSGCAGSSGPGTPAESYAASGQMPETSYDTLPDAADEQARFDAFSNQIFQENLRDDPLTLHFIAKNPETFGITEPEMKFPDFSLECLQNDSAENDTLLKELSSFDPSLLTSDQLFTLRMLKDTLETEALSKGLELYYQPLSALIGIQAQLPTLLAEYTFSSRTDIDNYLTLLSQIDTYYKQIAEYEKIQADAGLAPSDATIDRIINSCKSYLIRPENNLLADTFATRLNEVEGLSDAEKASYKAKHLAALKEHFIPAYTNLSKSLESIKGSHAKENGLSGYKKGKQYYAYLVASLTGTDSSVETLKKRIENQIESDLFEVQTRLKSQPELIRQMTDSAITLSEPEEILQNLQQQIQNDFPALDDTSYTIKYIPKALESVLSPAFFLVPPLDSDGSNTIYINNSASSEQNLYTILAHEGYPGHLYQSAYFNHKTPIPLRRLLTCGGYNEGWGLYSELYSYSFDNGLPEDVKPLMARSEASSYGLYAFLDICIHYDGWSLDKTTNYLQTSYGFTDLDAAREIYLAILDNPGNYLEYYTGYLEILSMRQTAEETLGNQFDPKEFHRFILSMDGASFRVIKPYFQTWLLAQQVNP